MSKKLIVSLVIVGVVVAIVLILFWTLFGLSSVSVEFASSLENLTVSAEEIVEAGQFRMGSCVLFEGKRKSVEKIYAKAKENPNFAYIRVLNIETVFPNKFVIHVAEREELFAVNYNGQTLICDRDLRVLNAREEISVDENATGEQAASGERTAVVEHAAFAGKPTIAEVRAAADENAFDGLSASDEHVILLDGLNILNESVAVGDFLDVGQESIKSFYAAFLKNNRSYSEVVGKFERAELSEYVEDVTGVKYDALTLSTFDGEQYVVKNPDFAFANKIALMYAVESELFSGNVDSDGHILDKSGQAILLAKTDDGRFVVADEGAENTVTLSLSLLQNCQIVIDNLTLSEYVSRTESDICFYLQEKA